MESISMAALRVRSRPDLILVDIIMLGELDGIQGAEIITRDYDIPIIFLTAWTDDDTVSRAKATNPYTFLLKPYNKNEVKVVRSILLCSEKLRRENCWPPKNDAPSCGAP